MIAENNLFKAKVGNVFVKKEHNVFYGDTLELGNKINAQGEVIPETIDDYFEVPEPENYELGGLYIED